MRSGLEMNMRRFRLPVIAIAITAVFELVYNAADSEGALTSYLASDAPEVVQYLWGRWSPLALGVRLARRLGYRFDHTTYSAPWQFDAISRTTAFFITFGLVWLVLWLSTCLRERSKRKLKAA